MDGLTPEALESDNDAATEHLLLGGPSPEALAFDNGAATELMLLDALAPEALVLGNGAAREPCYWAAWRLRPLWSAAARLRSIRLLAA